MTHSVRRICTDLYVRDEENASHLSSAHFLNLTKSETIEVPKNTMTCSRGYTVTPVAMDGSSGQVESQIDEVKGKENTVEYLAVLLQQENKLYPQCDDYLSELQSAPSSMDSDPVSESWRRKLCEWCFEVVDHFKASGLKT